VNEESRSDAEEMKGRRIGPYRILRTIASGGMGTVYEAEQIPLDRKVALKILPSHVNHDIDVGRDALMSDDRRSRRYAHVGDVAQTDVAVIFPIDPQIAKIVQTIARFGCAPDHHIQNLLQWGIFLCNDKMYSSQD